MLEQNGSEGGGEEHTSMTDSKSKSNRNGRKQNFLGQRQALVEQSHDEKRPFGMEGTGKSADNMNVLKGGKNCSGTK